MELLPVIALVISVATALFLYQERRGGEATRLAERLNGIEKAVESRLTALETIANMREVFWRELESRLAKTLIASNPRKDELLTSMADGNSLTMPEVHELKGLLNDEMHQLESNNSLSLAYILLISRLSSIEKAPERELTKEVTHTKSVLWTERINGKILDTVKRVIIPEKRK